LHEMLAEAQMRYRRPVFIAETGAEGSARAAWLHYVCGEVETARQLGVPVEGVCLYPILDYPGWENERVCPVGLLSMPDGRGKRTICSSLASELRRQHEIMGRAQARTGRATHCEPQELVNFGLSAPGS